MNLFQLDEIQIYTFFFVLLRVTSILFFLPILGDRVIPASVKVLFGLSLTFIVFPLLYTQGLRIPESTINSLSSIIGAACINILFGIALGFVTRWVFDAIQFAGFIIGTSIGFSIASVLDPHSETQTIALAELQYILAALLFLAMNGHHIYLVSILESFKHLSLTGVELLSKAEVLMNYLIRLSAEVVILGVKLSAPVLIVILIVNLAFGAVARAVPQMNVFAVSFTVNIIIGLAVVIISLPNFMNTLGIVFEQYTPEVVRFLKLVGG